MRIGSPEFSRGGPHGAAARVRVPLSGVFRRMLRRLANHPRCGGESPAPPAMPPGLCGRDLPKAGRGVYLRLRKQSSGKMVKT